MICGVDCGALLQVIFYICILNNTFICVLLYLGAGAVFQAATGMSVYAAVMCAPLLTSQTHSLDF